MMSGEVFEVEGAIYQVMVEQEDSKFTIQLLLSQSKEPNFYGNATGTIQGKEKEQCLKL